MRTVAAYTFRTPVPIEISENVTFHSLSQLVHSWLQFKGLKATVPVPGISTFTLTDGRQATLNTSTEKSREGLLNTWSLIEPSGGGEFKTNIFLSQHNGSIEVYCTLETGHTSTVVAPVTFDARCPRVLRSLLENNLLWTVGHFRISAKKLRLINRDGGARLCDLIQDEARTLPLVVVSELSSMMLHPDLDDSLARELVGLAQVVSINEAASWELTNQLTQVWSCFNGSVRIYWPASTGINDPYAHSLWTASKLMSLAGSSDQVTEHICTRIRKSLMGLSSFTVSEPTSIRAIRSALSCEEHERRRKELESLRDSSGMVELYVEENRKLSEENRLLREEVLKLRADVANERFRREWLESEQGATDTLAPEKEGPPRTVKEAVLRASERFEIDLLFGDDVNRGVATLNETAGPPDKIFSYLSTLAEAAQIKRKGALGNNVVSWLSEKGVSSSGEGKLSRAEVADRTWKDGKGTRFFSNHMKPKEATSPAQCVRIYFDWDDKLKKFIVGWVGRHP